MTYLCIVCLNKKRMYDDIDIICEEVCANIICSSCINLNKKYSNKTLELEIIWYCSDKCIIDSMKRVPIVWDTEDMLEISKSSPPIVHQEEIFRDILKTNTYKHVLKIYPNVLADIIAEYV